MDDDFNTALALGNLYGYFKRIKAKIAAGDKTAGADLNQIKTTYSLLGLFTLSPEEFLKTAEREKVKAVPQEVTALAEQRLAARKNKDWALSDELRNKIAALGYEIKDGKDGYTLTEKK